MLNLKAKLKTAQHRTVNTIGLNPDAVFIWIPKSAGTSLYNSLEKLGCPKAKEVHRIARTFPQKGLVTFGHMDYLGLVEAGLVSREFHERSTKFAIVRDPYERATSLYFYIKDKHRHFDLWHKTPSFEEFLELLDKGFNEKVGLYNNRGMSQANPQVHWTRGIELDFIGRVEQMDEAIAGISSLIGKQIPQAKWLNRGEKPSSGELYTKQARYLVDKLFDEDFATFDYPRKP